MNTSIHHSEGIRKRLLENTTGTLMEWKKKFSRSIPVE